MGDVVLYNIPPSLCSQKVRLVLVEMGIPFQNRWVDIGLTAENYEPWYVKLNPKCVVPTLVHGETVVTNSVVIMRYVAEHFEGPALLPDDPEERARMEHWYALAEALDFRLFTFSRVHPRLIAFGLQKKLKKLRAYAERYPELRAAYEAKIEDITGLKDQSRDPETVKRQRAARRACCFRNTRRVRETVQITSARLYVAPAMKGWSASCSFSGGAISDLTVCDRPHPVAHRRLVWDSTRQKSKSSRLGCTCHRGPPLPTDAP